MDLEEFGRVATSHDGVRRTAGRWTLHGRLIARELDPTHVVIRVPFEVRDDLVHRHPATFSVPKPFAQHMKVVADLTAGDDEAIEEAVAAAWQMQAIG